MRGRHGALSSNSGPLLEVAFHATGRNSDEAIALTGRQPSLPNAGDGCPSSDHPVTIWTIGHSTLPIESFLDALTANAIALLVDVRRFPGSRRHPQFSREALAQSLASSGIDYAHDEALGGRRGPRADTHNTAWRNDGFRGYADYMETPAFSRAIDALLREEATRPVAIMCAEMLWWQCHRGLIADYLKARDHEVVHIGAGGKTEPHPFTSAARIIDGRLSYQGLLDRMS